MRITQSVIDKFWPLVQRAFVDMLAGKTTSSPAESKKDAVKSANKPLLDELLPTDKELETYNVIKDALSGKIPVDKLYYRKNSNYFSIYIADQPLDKAKIITSWIAIIRINSQQQTIIIKNDNHKNAQTATPFAFNKAEDILGYKKELLEAIKKYV